MTGSQFPELRFPKRRNRGFQIPDSEDTSAGIFIRPACLIIDEVGRCEFDKENTRLFFDMIDRRYNRDGTNNIIFTSNKVPALWKNDFNEDDLLCALDRIFDDATVFNIRGDSCRGKHLENIALKTTRVSAASSSEQSE